ncbi:MAG: hypothetical protein JSU82_10570 [Rhodospirillales bacterium]|nr:MAG: hypothetical protein JSU82_10570 [Rhodospirillales bacterium]
MIRRVVLSALLFASLGLAACSAAPEPADEAAVQLAPYSAMAFVPPAADPQELLGLNAGEVTAKLGQPALIRREGDAEVWQYRQTDCVLDLFLYGTGRQVEHVDLRDRGDATQAAVQACFERLLEKGGAGPEASVDYSVFAL